MRETGADARNVASGALFVTGGGSGIGLSMAQAFARRGGRVAIADIDMARARSAADALAADGAQAVAIELDVADPAAWPIAADEAERALGPVGVLHSNAGISGHAGDGGGIENFPIDRWRRTMAVNLDGHLHAVRTFLPRFKDRDTPSHIVLTASVAGLRRPRRMTSPAYVTSKFATIGLAEYLHEDLARFPRIGCSVLCPGIVKTRIADDAGAPESDDAPRGMAGRDAVSRGMNADGIGDFVLDRMLDGAFYIMTHPEYRPLVDRYHTEISRSFIASAQPGHTDPIPVEGYS